MTTTRRQLLAWVQSAGLVALEAVFREEAAALFRISEMVENPVEFSEREQRAPTGEPQIDGRLAGLLSTGKVLEHGQRLLEIGDGLAVGRTTRRVIRSGSGRSPTTPRTRTTPSGLCCERSSM